MTRIFLGPNGLRVGWRLVIAISLWFVLSGLLPIFVIWIPGVRAMLREVSVTAPRITPALLIFQDAITASAALLTALVMTRIEQRSFADYGLPRRAAFGKRFWQGWIYGFTMISALLGLLAALRGFSIQGATTVGLVTVREGLLYFGGFIATAVFEEFAFRGYLQSTLQLTTGFWPAAVILAVAFVGVHILNPGETRFGLAMVGCFALLAAFTLRRTGNLWFIIGLHAAWDWGETFFYSVPDSGVPAVGHFLRSEFHGPEWLTGGTVGPEGSVLVFGVMALAALGIHFLLPDHKQ
jgi:membrane protease YdiL (CAAX protease family)